MYRIKSVAIEGFWGRYDARATLHPDVNVLIGKNGSGKTTFMDLLFGALKVDFRMLSSHRFSSIELELSSSRSHRTIRVTRERRDQPVEVLRFQVGRRAFTFPMYSPDMDTVRHIAHRPQLQEQYIAVREEIRKIVDVASLSVHRTAQDQPTDEEFSSSRRRRSRPPIDIRVEELLRNLTAYQLLLAERQNGVSTRFQRSVLATMLYDERFDVFKPSEVSGVDLSQQKTDLVRAYRELGLTGRSIHDRISEHFAALERSLGAVRANAEQKSGIRVDDIMPLPLLGRTQRVIELSLEAENAKRDINKPMADFEAILRSFIADKSLRIAPNGELTVHKDDQPLEIASLSSGEKQLLILLTETLLQRNLPFVFLADEPELSLHIEWQARIIETIQALNSSAQVVVATHSPEIAAGWKTRLIDMAEVIRA